MATMTRPARSLRDLNRIIRDEMLSEHQSGEQVRPCYLLRRDGQTDEYEIVGDRVRVTRTRGHTTFGLALSDRDLPCIVSE
jgi:hypothetical protein